MKSVILHRGYGTKLRPLTHTGPKQLTLSQKNPISENMLEDHRNSDITETDIILGSIHPEKSKGTLRRLPQIRRKKLASFS